MFTLLDKISVPSAGFAGNINKFLFEVNDDFYPDKGEIYLINNNKMIKNYFN